MYSRDMKTDLGVNVNGVWLENRALKEINVITPGDIMIHWAEKVGGRVKVASRDTYTFIAHYIWIWLVDL